MKKFQKQIIQKNHKKNNNQEDDRFQDFLRFFKFFFVIVEAISWDIEVMKTSIFLLFDPLHFELIRGYN